MKKIYSFLAAALATATLAGCASDTFDLEGEGTVTLRTTISNDVKVVSRAMTAEELSEKCNIWISSPKGLVRKYEGIDNVPAGGVTLLSGHYIAEAWTGDSLPASFEAKYYKGRQEFDVANGQNTSVDLTCRVANVVTSVVFSDEAGKNVDDVLSDYSMTIEHTRGELTFEGRDDRKGYFMMPNGVNTLHYTLRGTKKDGTQYVRTGDIPNVQPTTEYVITVKCSTDNSEFGGGYLTIEIDARELDIEDTITISAAPELVGQGFNFADGITGLPGEFTRKSVWVMASAQLQSVIIESEILEKYTALGYADIDLINASSSQKDLLNGDMMITYTYDDVKDVSSLKITFEAQLLNKIDDGNYTVSFTAKDVNGRESAGTLNITVSGDPVVLNPADAVPGNFWATSATLVGSKLNDKGTNLHFEYRKQGASTWISVPAVESRAGTKVTATVTGLTPGTAYEYRLVCDQMATDPVSFTTEAAAILPNGGFEEWNTSKTPYLLYAAGGQMFWDSGNKGSSKMSKNVTTPDSEIKHSGQYSAKLASQWVGMMGIGKFAAGNCFTGEFLGTENTYYGILGWGRPFSSRPVKLRGYVRYEPVAINYTENNTPADIKKGDMDRGAIYIALMDNTPDTYNAAWPFVLRNDPSVMKLFNRNAPNVIAYGEKFFDATGSQFIEFEITLDYYRTDVKASNILIVCSSSKAGDYYTGGNGSTMWVDDLELVY